MTKEENTTENLKSKVTDSNAWLRLLFILLFAAIYSVAEIVLAAVVAFQFLYVLFTGNRNDKVLSLGAQVSTFAYQVFRYMTYNSDERPFPFADWPTDALLAEQRVVSKPVTRRPAAPRKKAGTAKAKTDGKVEKAADTD